jgi:hypothetical protein
MSYESSGSTTPDPGPGPNSQAIITILNQRAEKLTADNKRYHAALQWISNTRCKEVWDGGLSCREQAVLSWCPVCVALEALGQ